MTGHAEIAGGGIAGLSVGLALAAHGWSTRIHEKASAIRESGAGIYLRRNSLEILQEFGVLDELKPKGTKIDKTFVVDADGIRHQQRDTSGEMDLWVFPRQALIEAIENRARSVGVEVVLDSPAASADPSGALILENGSRLEADLVIAADGMRSRVRDSVVSGATAKKLPTLVSRHFIDGRRISSKPTATMHWSGKRRIGICGAGPDNTYVFTVCPEWDEAGKKLPINVDEWAKSFPKLRPELEVISATPVVTQYNYPIVHSPTWHAGRVAILGDAATGLPPTLGQGAGLAIMNGLGLALALEKQPTVEEALAFWESEVRFISDVTQRWSCRYDWFSRAWPSGLNFLRPALFRTLNGLVGLDQQLVLADKGLEQTALRP